MTLPPEQRLEALHAELLAERDARVDAGLCGCGCGTLLPPRRHARLRYVGTHKDRAHRERIRREAEVLGVEVRQSLTSLRTTASTAERRADAQAPRKRAQARPRPGVSIYLPRPELVALLEGLLATPSASRDVVDLQASVAKAKARLERRRG